MRNGCHNSLRFEEVVCVFRVVKERPFCNEMVTFSPARFSILFCRNCSERAHNLMVSVLVWTLGSLAQILFVLFQLKTEGPGRRTFLLKLA